MEPDMNTIPMQHSNLDTNTIMADYNDDRPPPELEIIGLLVEDDGRQCMMHEKCGEHVEEGDLLRLKDCVVPGDGEPELAIKLVKIWDGMETCTVGYVPRALASMPKIKRNVGKFVQVTELYRNSDNTHKKRVCKMNNGMAAAVFIDDIPQLE